MQKYITQFEHAISFVVDGKTVLKTFRFLCDVDSQIPHAKEALVQFMTQISEIEENIKAQMEAQETPPVEAAPVVTEVAK
jgi:hypothetical protein